MAAKPSEEKAAKNTDREIWRKIPEDYYSPSIHVTKGGGIGINVGGFVHVRPIEEWHSMAATIAADRKRFNEQLDGYTTDWANQKRNFQKRIAVLRDRMIEAKQIIEKAHGRPNKDACCETCYILEQLDKWIEALHPKEENKNG